MRRAGAGPGSHALPDGQPPVARHTCSHVVLGAVRQPCDWGPAHRRVSLQRESSLVLGYQMGMITQHCLQLPCSQAAAPGTISYPVQTKIQLSPLGRARPVGVGHMAVEAVQGRPPSRGAAASPVPRTSGCSRRGCWRWRWGAHRLWPWRCRRLRRLCGRCGWAPAARPWPLHPASLWMPHSDGPPAYCQSQYPLFAFDTPQSA